MALKTVGGVDTHKDTHTAAVISEVGARLGIQTFPTSSEGYTALIEWMRSFGDLRCAGVKGAGSYGAGLARRLARAEIPVTEVIRPNRLARRFQGKSDPTDALQAAHTALSQNPSKIAVPKAQNGKVEAIRILRVQRRSAMTSRTQAVNRLHAMVATAHEVLRAALVPLATKRLLETVRGYRVSSVDSPLQATKFTLRGLARRIGHLDAEIAELNEQLACFVKQAAPEMVALPGAGIDTVGALLVAAGDNPCRLRTDASFAALCGVAPVDASSGKQRRHRLNRGGNRDANRALWTIVLIRCRVDPRLSDPLI